MHGGCCIPCFCLVVCPIHFVRAPPPPLLLLHELYPPTPPAILYWLTSVVSSPCPLPWSWLAERLSLLCCFSQAFLCSFHHTLSKTARAAFSSFLFSPFLGCSATCHYQLHKEIHITRRIETQREKKKKASQ